MRIGEGRVHRVDNNQRRAVEATCVSIVFSREARNERISRALVFVHGINRDADNHFRTALAAAFLEEHSMTPSLLPHDSHPTAPLPAMKRVIVSSMAAD